MNTPEILYASKEEIFQYSKEHPGKPLLALFEGNDSNMGLAVYNEARDLISKLLSNPEKVQMLDSVVQALHSRGDAKVVVAYLQILRKEQEGDRHVSIHFGAGSFLKDDVKPEGGDITNHGFLSPGGDA